MTRKHDEAAAAWKLLEPVIDEVDAAGVPVDRDQFKKNSGFNGNAIMLPHRGGEVISRLPCRAASVADLPNGCLIQIGVSGDGASLVAVLDGETRQKVIDLANERERAREGAGQPFTDLGEDIATALWAWMKAHPDSDFNDFMSVFERAERLARGGNPTGAISATLHF